VSAFERHAVARTLRRAAEAGVEIPESLTGLLATMECHSYPGKRWADEHPDADPSGCCWGAIFVGSEACTCWEPVYDVEQAALIPPASAADIAVRTRMCADCAYRPDSPERSDVFTEEALLELPSAGELFWCHDGLRRPTHWVHPDGRTVDGSPHDYRPAQLKGIPYQADGHPALLCAGWMARVLRS